jgi:3-oxoacyl-[acyl-carrier protein] reductase
MTTTANGKTVLVTGGSRGIGAAIAKQLAGIGMNAVINYASNEGAANEVVRSITAAGGVAIAVKGDVSKSDQFAHLFDQAELRFGGLDMLVNNAGQMSSMPIANVDEEKFDRLFAINVRGVLNGCKLAVKRLRDGGRIVNISTSVIGMSPPGYGPYCATKAAVEALTRSLCKEVGQRGIRVNAVAPGPTDTELLSSANSEDRMKMYASMTPLGRLGQAGDIAGVVVFLATDEAGWVNGQTIRVNGGMVA